MLSSIIISLCVFIPLIYAYKIFYSLWLGPKLLEKKLRAQGLKGNPYKFLYGDAKEIMSMIKDNTSKSLETCCDDIMAHVVPYHHHYTKLYGKTYFAWMGPTPRLVVMEPELVKDIFNQYTVFQRPKLNSLGKLLVPGLAVKEGQEWVKHRTILNPSFYHEKVKLMIPEMHSSCSEMISKWEELLSKKESCELDVQPDLTNLSADIISRTAFGSNYEEGKRMFILQREQSALALQLLHSMYIPGWSWLPTRSNRRLKEINREAVSLMKDIINKRVKALKEGRGKSTDDLLEILVKTNLSTIEEHGNKKHALTTEEIIDECKLFYIAGQEATTVTLLWTMVLLGKYQMWQDRAREEIRAVFGENKPDFDGCNHLKVLTMFVYEVLRLYPPLTNMNRAVHKKAKLGNYDLPAGTEIMVPVMAIQTDHEIWGKDATEFNPERFSEGVAKATDKRSIFLPFSTGPRVCIAQNMALLEVKLAVSMILQRFSIQLSPSYVHAPSPTLLMIQPQHGVPLILKKAKSL